VAARLTHDDHRGERERMRRHYFGDLAPGQSTERFLAAIDDVIAARDRLIRRIDAVNDTRSASKTGQRQ